MKNYGFFRAAVGSIIGEIGNPRYNRIQMENMIRQAASENVSLLVFPELSITSYSCGDLFFNQALIKSALEETIQLSKITKELQIAVIVGLPLDIEGKLYNCAAFLADGEIKGFIPKSNIPNYSEFYEARWFNKGNSLPTNTVFVQQLSVPVDPSLIFSIDGVKIGVEICEDLWTSESPSIELAKQGAIVLCNLSASNTVVGKSEYRLMLVQQSSATSHCAYLFSSAGLGESSTDTLYNGHCIICENGSLLTQGQQEDFSPLLLTADVDIERLLADRRRINTFTLTHPKQVISCSMKPKEFSLNRQINKTPFVPSQRKNRDKRMQEIYQIQSLSLAKRLRHTGLKKMIIGISGGLDSTLALLVAVKTADILRIDRKNIYGITMPGFGTTKRTKSNAEKLMEALGVTAKEISIYHSCKQHFLDIGQDENTLDVVFENAQARERTQILLDLANKLQGIVVGTGDLSELALGFTTFAGDHISMYGVNVGVPKTLVRYLVSWTAEQYDQTIKQVLDDILDTPVSPELLPPDSEGRIQQKTEDLVGDYVLHDFFLYYFLRFGFGADKIRYLAQTAFKGDFSNQRIRECLTIFFKRFFSQQFKRSCLPDGPKIGSVALSPRADWRMPSDADCSLWLTEIE